MIGMRSTTTTTYAAARTTTPSPRDLMAHHLSSSSSKRRGESDDSDSSESPRFVGSLSHKQKTSSEGSDVADRLVALLKRERKGYRYKDCVSRHLRRVKREKKAQDELARDCEFPPSQDQDQNQGQDQQRGGQGQLRDEDGGGPMIPPLNPSWRADICSWVFRVVDEHRVPPPNSTRDFNGGSNGAPQTSMAPATITAPALGNEIAIATMSYLDRYLVSAHGNVCSDRTVLLACLAALRLATKLYSPVPFEMGFFLWVGRGQFTSQDVEGMERDVLSELGWHVHPPTGVEFAHHLVELLSCCCCGNTKDSTSISISSGMTGEVLARATRFLTGATTSDPYFVPIGSSSVALAAVINAMEDVGLFDQPQAFVGLAFLDRLASLAASDEAGKNDAPRLSPCSPEVQAARCRLIEMERAIYERQCNATASSSSTRDEDEACHWITP